MENPSEPGQIPEPSGPPQDMPIDQAVKTDQEPVAMEIHHTSHKTRTKWFHYLWDFILLFLAVFCGILADNWREHYIERKREKQFIKTLIADLQSDEAQTRFWIKMNGEISKGMDSLMMALKSPDALTHAEPINRYFSYAKQDIPFVPAVRTITQLKYSGNMRLIKSISLSDSLLQYDQLLQFVEGLHQEMKENRKDAMNSLYEIVDENTLAKNEAINRSMIPVANANTILTSERVKLNMAFNKLTRLKELEASYSQALQLVSYKAKKLILLIQREYRIT